MKHGYTVIWRPAVQVTLTAHDRNRRRGVNVEKRHRRWRCGQVSFWTAQTASIIEWLQLTGATSPIFLIVDEHPIHKAAKVKRFVESTSGMLELFLIPPCSPHLNPDEVACAHVKRDVASKVADSKEEMKALAPRTLRRLQKLPDLVRSFFGQPALRCTT